MPISLNEKILLWSMFVITSGSISAIAIILIKKNLGKDVDEGEVKKVNWKNLLIFLSYLPVILGSASVRFYEEFWIAMAFAVMGGTIIFLIIVQMLKKDNKEYSEMGKAYEVVSAITIAFRFAITYILFVLIFFGFDIKRVMSLIISTQQP